MRRTWRRQTCQCAGQVEQILVPGLAISRLSVLEANHTGLILECTRRVPGSPSGFGPRQHWVIDLQWFTAKCQHSMQTNLVPACATCKKQCGGGLLFTPNDHKRSHLSWCSRAVASCCLGLNLVSGEERRLHVQNIIGKSHACMPETSRDRDSGTILQWRLL
eukprot:5824633-Amphidinium_carterae.1